MSGEKRSTTRDEKLAKQQDEIQDLRDRQNAGDIDKVTANRNSKYKISELEEEGYVHVATRIKDLNPDQKSFTNRDAVLSIHKGEFDRKVKEGYFQLFDEVEVIHDPRENAPDSYVLKPATLSTEAPKGLPSAELNERVNKLKGREKELNEAGKAIEKRQKELAGIHSTLSNREQELNEREAKLKSLDDELAAKKAELDKQPIVTLNAGPLADMTPAAGSANAQSGSTETAATKKK